MNATAEAARAGEVLLGQPREAYDASPRVNWSKLRAMARSPLHYAHALQVPPETTDAQRLGLATDVAILEPSRFAAEYAPVGDGRYAAGKAEREAARAAGKVPLPQKDWDEALAMRAAVAACPLAMEWLQGDRQVSVFWSLSGDGWAFDCKGRFDVLGPRAIVDLKTTRDGSLRGFEREVARYKYHAQAAFYVDGYFAATERVLPYLLVVVENSPPYPVTVRRLSPEALDVGRRVYSDLLGKLHECRTRDEWGGYANSVVDLGLPAWALEETYE